MLAKLRGFLWSESRVFRSYPETDQSFHAIYARAIAKHREGSTDDALADLDTLLETDPDDVFVVELMGQMNFELGRFREASNHYRRAAELAPRAPLILSAFGESLVTLNYSGKTCRKLNPC